jgi:chromosome segregation ATPase
VLYLAEVQKKSGFMSSNKADFKLLACQRSEQNWSSVPGDEVVGAPDDAASYAAGALVMVEMSANRQVQRHSMAGPSLVSILQNFSNASKKFKTQEEEIEQWKESLTYQSQELNRREMEIDSRQEEIEQASADLEKLDAQRKDLEQQREENEKLRQEFERKSQELEGAWAHLNGELQRFEERQADFNGQASGGLDEAQTYKIQDVLNRLVGHVTPTDPIREQLNAAFESINQQQGNLDGHWQAFNEQRSSVSDKQGAVAHQEGVVNAQRQSFAEAQKSLEHFKNEAKKIHGQLETQHAQSQLLGEQLNYQSALYQQVYELLNTGDKVRLSKKIDVASLEAMPMNELETFVGELEKDLDKMSRFVNDQEEELKFQQQAIDEVKVKMETASEYDRLQLETEMEDEQDRYRMLNETLVGQRRNLTEREEVLSQNRAVLWRRQGRVSDEAAGTSTEDLEPVLNRIDEQRQALTQQIQSVDEAIKASQAKHGEAEQQANQKATELEQQQEMLSQAEQSLVQLKVEAAELQAHIQTYESCLQPIQDRLTELRHKLEEVSGLIGRVQESSDYQLQAIAEMQQTVQSLVAQPA